MINEEIDENEIKEKAKNLNVKTDYICRKIEQQTKILEDVQRVTDNEIKRFEENQMFFTRNLEKMKNDGRNALIIMLIIIIIGLSNMLRHK